MKLIKLMNKEKMKFKEFIHNILRQKIKTKNNIFKYQKLSENYQKILLENFK